MILVAVLCACAFAQSAVVGVPQSAYPDAQAVAGADAIAIPQMLSYQGKLTDTTGIPVPDGDYSVVFRLYTAPSGGSPVWNETQSVATKDGLFSNLLGSVTPIGSVPDAGAAYLGMAVAGGNEMTPRLRIASAAYSYLSARAAYADLLQGRDTTTFSRSTHNHDATYVNEAQTDAITSGMIVNGTIAAADLGQMGASSGQVMKWTGSAWSPRNDSVGGGTGDNAWVRGTPDSVLYTVHRLGIARGEASNMLYGTFRQSHVNLGVSCTTGVSGQNYSNLTIGGGLGNTVGAAYSTVAGGLGNRATGIAAAVAGGAGNIAGDAAADTGATIAGGYSNAATGMFATVGGGKYDSATGHLATVGGGWSNKARGDLSVVGGGIGNIASNSSATVAGGNGNQASGSEATVGGGNSNEAGGDWATVDGGILNTANGDYSAVGGGDYNTAAGTRSAVAGGGWNNALGVRAFVGGGYGNSAGDSTLDTAAVVAGGYANLATARYATVGGGKNDTASGSYATVGGGEGNAASDAHSTVAGGYYNKATGYRSFVGGGLDNEAGGYEAVLAGGSMNHANGQWATVAGGVENSVGGARSTVGGGQDNSVSGYCSTVPGGDHNSASGDFSLAAGTHAKARATGTFVWSDSCGAADSVRNATAHRWMARARGGVYFYTNLGMTTGSYLAAGGSSWNSVSDSMTKENFRPVDKKALLDAVARMRVRDYNLKSQDASIRHIGPVAQDFHNSFGFGESSTAINMEDADGVALAAIQALYEDNRQLRQELEALKAELAQQKR